MTAQRFMSLGYHLHDLPKNSPVCTLARIHEKMSDSLGKCFHTIKADAKCAIGRSRYGVRVDEGHCKPH